MQTKLAEKVEHQRTGPSVKECNALLDRIAASEHFRRSNRLHDFLLYVGHETLKEHPTELNEQEIGAKVFDRATDYDTSQDNIVRVNASELRKRIDQYFATEGINESLMLEIPRGGYKPHFYWREPAIAQIPLANTPQETPSITPHQQPIKIYRFIWPVATLLLAGFSALQIFQLRTLQLQVDPSTGKPTVAAFWKDFHANHKPTDIVLPDDSISLAQDISKQPITLSDYLNRNYLRQIQTSSFSDDRKNDITEVLGHNLVTYGGVHAAYEVLPFVNKPPARVVVAHFYEAVAMKTNNVIFIGGEKANPWVHLFDDQLNFITTYDFQVPGGHPYINNLHPAPGEPSKYMTTNRNSYSVLAYMPSLDHTSNVIILAGTDSDSTGAAAEFLVSEVQMAKLKKLFHVQTLPHFEVLLRTAPLGGTSLDTEIVAYRLH